MAVAPYTFDRSQLPGLKLLLNKDIKPFFPPDKHEFKALYFGRVSFSVVFFHGRFYVAPFE